MSARPSLLNEANYKALTGTTVEYKKQLGYQEAQLDFRSRIVRFGVAGLVSQQVVLGYVTSVGPSGVFIAIGKDIVARAN